MQSINEKFWGTWNLAAANFFTAAGELVPLYGADPLGYIRYDAQGRMSVQIMERNRPRLPMHDEMQDPLEAYTAIVRGYIAYFGTFDVDEAKGTIAHHVKGSLVPEWVGTDLIRAYEFSGNRLYLRFPPTRLRG